ncbi:MAG TPA: serine/threonine-protein kinase [Kofleriaceae bacterium]
MQRLPAEDEDSAELEAAVRDACPAADDLASRVVRSRVAAGLFAKHDRVRIGRYELERQVGQGGGGVVFAAWDPELSRRIAIKLIDVHGRRERVLGEAHALARLAHPNVVSIFDVGTHGEQIFLVMELVDGATLRGWVDSSPRTMREIVRAYRQAGEGLAAAHRAGFVHRDFKPDNALIGSDGRVRVVDFGLVHVEGSTGAPGVGTPRYMAPEQLEGGPITPAVDEYAFCAALREAATRRRDASGTRTETIPRWIEVITARGLARDPRDRHPSFDVLLRALARDPASRWKRRGLVAGVAIIGLTAFVVGRSQTSGKAACPDGRTELATAWGPVARASVVAQLDSLTTPYAHQVRPHILAALDGYAGRWVLGQKAACTARDRGIESDALFDRRIGCLDRARAALASVVGVLRRTSADQLAPAVTSVSELPALERCSDQTALDDRIEPPPSAKTKAVAQLDRELAALEVEVRAGHAHLAEVRQAAARLVERARALEYRPLLARALRVTGVASLARTAREEAIAPFREATSLAFAAGADELGVELFARRAWAEGMVRDPERALDGLQVIEALASRLPDVARPTRALLENNVGSVELASGRPAQARERFALAVRELEAARGGISVELAQVPANLALVTDDPVERSRLFASTIGQLTAKLGADHPHTLDARINAAATADDAAVAQRETESACTAYRALHPEHGAIADCAFDLAWFALDRGDPQAARTWFAAVVTAEAHGGDATLAALSRAHLVRLDGNAREAVAAFAHIVAATATGADAPWWQRLLAAEANLGAGLAARDAGDRSAARVAFTRAAETLDQIIAIKPGAARRRALERARRELAAP